MSTPVTFSRSFQQSCVESPCSGAKGFVLQIDGCQHLLPGLIIVYDHCPYHIMCWCPYLYRGMLLGLASDNTRTGYLYVFQVLLFGWIVEACPLFMHCTTVIMHHCCGNGFFAMVAAPYLDVHTRVIRSRRFGNVHSLAPFTSLSNHCLACF